MSGPPCWLLEVGCRGWVCLSVVGKPSLSKASNIGNLIRAVRREAPEAGAYLALPDPARRLHRLSLSLSQWRSPIFVLQVHSGLSSALWCSE